MTAIHQSKTINLALQGGGSHGAFTWGVLDRLLEEDRLVIEAISGTSAGAMNGAMLKTGFLDNGREGARSQLDQFWGSVRRSARGNVNPLTDWLALFSNNAAQAVEKITVERSALLRDSFSRSLSPYDWNPLNINPIKDLLESLINFDLVCRACYPHLFVSATNVRTGKIKVFSGDELSIDAILASACLPDLFQTIEIDGQPYWDGGFMGNPALFPLFYRSDARDIVIVHVNPIERAEIPRTARDIQNRTNEISFNSSLLSELRAVAFVRRLIAEGKLASGEMKDVLIHSISDDPTMLELSASTKISPKPELLDRLKDAGRIAAESFLRQHWDNIGIDGSIDLRAILD
ncbi:MAG TPA: patatin-like phospholipase family protein [Thermohalobaculum sp.]|nr:patatin-like phospholipase family protein [Thermohalobaculum sp.]